MIPHTPGPKSSRIEASLFDALRRMDSEWTGLYSVEYVTKRDGQLVDGEADFLLVGSDIQVVAIEAKGGELSVEEGQWYSTDRFGKRRAVKDPFAQGRKAKYFFIQFLNNRLSFRVNVAQAVLIEDEDLDLSRLPPNADPALILTSQDLRDPKKLQKKVQYLAARQGASHLSPYKVDLVLQALKPTEVQNPGYRAIRDVERSIERATSESLLLTTDQLSALESLSGSRRLLVQGRAGTGKTIVALERTRELMASGLDVLYVTASRTLASSAASLLFNEVREWRPADLWSGYISGSTMGRVLISTSFDLVGHLDSAAGETADYPMGGRPGHAFGKKATHSGRLDESSLVASAISDRLSCGLQFDSLIVDEAQDVGADLQLALVLLMSDPDNAPLYFFADPYQRSQHRSSNFDVAFDAPTMPLVTCCRSSREIASFVEALGVPSGPGIDTPGPAPLVFARDSVQSRADSVVFGYEQLTEILGIDPADIRIVSTPTEYRNLRLGDLLPSRRLQFGERFHLTVDECKGLEAVAVICVLGDESTHEVRNLAYMAITRARSYLILIAPQRTLDGLNLS